MTLTQSEIDAENLTDWSFRDGALHARFDSGNFAGGLELVNQIGAAAEAADHHPDIDLRYDHIQVKLWSHDAGGVTRRDVALAREISELAN